MQAQGTAEPLPKSKCTLLNAPTVDAPPFPRGSRFDEVSRRFRPPGACERDPFSSTCSCECLSCECPCVCKRASHSHLWFKQARRPGVRGRPRPFRGRQKRSSCSTPLAGRRRNSGNLRPHTGSRNSGNAGRNSGKGGRNSGNRQPRKREDSRREAGGPPPPSPPPPPSLPSPTSPLPSS